MGLFDRIFGGFMKKEEEEPKIRFGRFSEIYKTPQQLEAWKSSLKAFEKKEYLQAYRLFFDYLNDPKQDNVKYWDEAGLLKFEILQGSKKIVGEANSEKVHAVINVVHCERLNVGFMRRLLDLNFGLRHSKFTLNEENNICMKFDSFLIDGSPFKLYASLKEMATKSDKMDDLLLDEFEMLKAIDNEHVESLPVDEANVKYNFMIKWYDHMLSKIEALHPTKDAVSVSIIIRYFIYKLDYLVQPEGYLMELLERCHKVYYARDNQSAEQKNDSVLKELQDIKKRSREEFDKEFYKVPATFGITAPVNHDWVVGAIESEIAGFDWYINNNQENVAIDMVGFIATYSLFNYAVPQPDREYFHLIVEILEADYFEALGIKHDYYDRKTGKFDKSAVRNEIYSIEKSNKEKFPQIDADTGKLKYKSLSAFMKSFLLVIKALNLSPAEAE